MDRDGGIPEIASVAVCAYALAILWPIALAVALALSAMGVM